MVRQRKSDFGQHIIFGQDPNLNRHIRLTAIFGEFQLTEEEKLRSRLGQTTSIIK